MDGTVMYRESDSYNVRGLLSGKTVQRGRTWKATSTPMTATDRLLELVNTDAAGTPRTERYTFDENRKRLTANGMAAAYGYQDRLLSVGEAVYCFDDNSYPELAGRGCFRVRCPWGAAGGDRGERDHPLHL